MLKLNFRHCQRTALIRESHQLKNYAGLWQAVCSRGMMHPELPDSENETNQFNIIQISHEGLYQNKLLFVSFVQFVAVITILHWFYTMRNAKIRRSAEIKRSGFLHIWNGEKN